MKPRRNVTIRDVARHAGVSPITASRALSKPALVREETRLRVEESATILNFIPNQAAGILANRRSNMVGVIVPTLSNSIFADTIQAVADILGPAGVQLLIGSNDYSPELEEQIIKTFISHRADALILTGHSHTERAEHLISEFRLPTVEMWNISDTSPHICVGMSNWKASYEMTCHLISRGYRRIGYIGGLLENNDRSADRLRGYRDALADNGISQDENILRHCSFDFLRGAEAMRSLLAEPERPDCVFAASDIIAFGALLECQNSKISIPDDIALAGFDDALIGSLAKPALTTVRVPRRQIGLKVGRLIMKLLDGEGDIEKIHDLGFELTIRDSA